MSSSTPPIAAAPANALIQTALVALNMANTAVSLLGMTPLAHTSIDDPIDVARKAVTSLDVLLVAAEEKNVQITADLAKQAQDLAKLRTDTAVTDKDLAQHVAELLKTKTLLVQSEVDLAAVNAEIRLSKTLPMTPTSGSHGALQFKSAKSQSVCFSRAAQLKCVGCPISTLASPCPSSSTM